MRRVYNLWSDLWCIQGKRGHHRSHSSASSHSSGSKSSQLVEEDGEVGLRVTSPRPRVQTNESTSSILQHSSKLEGKREKGGEKREGRKCLFEGRRVRMMEESKNHLLHFLFPQGQPVVVAEMKLKWETLKCLDKRQKQAKKRQCRKSCRFFQAMKTVQCKRSSLSRALSRTIFLASWSPKKKGLLSVQHSKS